METDGSKELQPLITEAWLQQFEARVYRCAQTQLIEERDAHRLTALAMAVTLTGHQLLSELGGSSPVRDELGQIYAFVLGEATAAEAEPPSLSDMQIVMDMAATAFSLLEHRRIETGRTDADVPTEAIAGGLLLVMRRACQSGGARTSASLLPLLKPFSIDGCAR